MPILVQTAAELSSLLSAERAAAPSSVGLVMTMGALHEGHLSLVQKLKDDGHRVLVTIFVNPRQFGQGEDLDRYPRDLEADMRLLAGAGTDWVFAPDSKQMYPMEPRVTVQPGMAGRVLEGALRPGHFAGVLQIVSKVFNLVRPDVAAFGQKDAQQFVNIAQMVKDLNYPITLVEAPVVRAESGLALSSRNAYLTSAERDAATCLSRALGEGEESARSGQEAARIVEVVADSIGSTPSVELQYVALADQTSFDLLALWAPGPKQAALLAADTPPRFPGGGAGGTGNSVDAYLLVAAQVGSARLIDNVKVQVKSSE